MEGLAMLAEAFIRQPLAEDDPSPDMNSVTDSSLSSENLAMQMEEDLANYGPSLEEHSRHVRQFA